MEQSRAECRGGASDSTAPGTCGSEEAPGTLGMGRTLGKRFEGGHLSFLGSSPRWSPPSQVLFSLTKMLFQLVWMGRRLACPNSKEVSVNAFGANWPEWERAPTGARKARPPSTHILIQLQCSEDR